MKSALALCLLLFGLPAYAAGPCVRTGLAPAGGIDFEVVRCQVKLDADLMGEMQSQLNAATAALTLLRADLVGAEAQKKTLIEWLQAAQGEVRGNADSTTPE